MLKYYSHKYRYDWCQMQDINHCNILKFPPFYMAMMNVFIMFHVLICCSGLEWCIVNGITCIHFSDTEIKPTIIAFQVII